MQWLRVLSARIVGIFRKKTLLAEHELEMRSHFEMLVQDNLREGMSPEEARRQASLCLGSPGPVSDAYHQQASLSFFEVLFQDVRYGLRSLRKSPGFALAAIVTLALGIGGNTAIFTVVNGVLLQPFPYSHPAQLVHVFGSSPAKGERNYGASPPDFRQLREQNKVFESLSGYYGQSFNLTGSDRPEHLVGDVVSAEYFKTLGVSARLGRTFLPGEEEWGSHQVMVLSNALWRVRFHADPKIVGKTFDLSGEPYTVVGVMPAGFYARPGVQLWIPMAWAPHDNENSRNNYFLNMVGRLRPGVTLDQARTDIQSIMLAIAQVHPENKGITADLEPLADAVVGNVRRALELLLGAVGLILLIACVNVANLLLARSAGRQKEIAIRASLGAGRLRLVRQFLTESILLSLLGGALGLGLALWCIRLLPTTQDLLPRAQQIHLDGWVIAFTSLLSIFTGILFGLLPAWTNAKVDLNRALSAGGRTAQASRGRLRSVLVVTETALALVLLIGAGLAMKSFGNLLQVPRGFDASHILTFGVTLPPSYDPHPDPTLQGPPPQIREFYRRVTEGIRSLPGVEAAGVTTALPLYGDNWGKYFTPLDRPAPTSMDKVPLVEYAAVWGDSFRSLGIPLLRGRVINEHDDLTSPRVVVVNQALANRFWPGQNPIGKLIELDPPVSLIPSNLLPPGYKAPQFTVIGIVADTHYGRLNKQALPMVYGSLMQHDWQSTMAFVVRSNRDPASLVPAIRNELKEVDPNIPMADISTMDQIVSSSVEQPRVQAVLLGSFGALALLLATVGIFGVMSYTVSQRTTEIGIRMALGARRANVRRMIVWQGFRLAALGLTLGLLLAFFLTRFMQSLLFAVKPDDPFTFALVSLVLALVAVAACYFPARRATRIDPMDALRCQ